MLPIAPLMIEHRIIERMIDIVKKELENLRANNNPNIEFISITVDFIRTYADQTHHGKEEDILFRELKKKTLTNVHKKTMDELIQEHIIGRKNTSQLETAKNQYFSGKKETLNIILEKMEFLANFYPKHIEKEDKHFFLPVMSYFKQEEQNLMLEEGRIFDRKMIHKKYFQLVSKLEKSHNISKPKKSTNWFEFI